MTWSTDPVDRAAHRHDRSGWTPAVDPAFVAHVRGVEGVRHVLRHAHATGTPVVPRGAGTGLAGGATALDGAIVLDLTALDAVVDLDVDDEIATVQPGVVTADLDRAARAVGLRYAPDPASVEISTVGGNIATNAGGLHCAKYGVTRDAVLGLDVVLADGRLIHTGRRSVKGVTGYDLTALFVGSEGTLGVIVGATLRLRPLPLATTTISASFTDEQAAFAAMRAVRAAGVVPAVAEFLDGSTLAAIDAHTGSDLAARGAAFLLLQTDGAAADAEAALAAQQLRPLATQVAVTGDPEEAARLVAVRRAALPALENIGTVVIEDICVPRSRLAAAVASVREIATRTGTAVHTFAHAADGNLHPIVVLRDGETVEDPHIREATDAIFATALRLGGTVSGEHGVGVLKRRWMREELGEDVTDLQQRVKAAFDPTGILNPGRAI
ncbi:FAD-binding oxidoreductase [Jatrophihabitans sp. YIM 134969]